jgi:L-threonylcarbamoyladenylate synthase
MAIVRTSEQAVLQAAAELKAGRLVAFPTETVYGLGADATNARAVALIFEAKGRPRFNPLIVHVADVLTTERIAVLTPAARRLAEAFWPGPLTLVLKRRKEAGISDLVTAGLDTVAVRIPAHPVAQAVLRAVDRPIAAPSANRSGHVSATTAAHVADDLGEAPALIIDGGPTEHGLESTVLDASGYELVLLRPGAVTAERIEAVTGRSVARNSGADADGPRSPGQLLTHYAPRARVRVEATSVAPGEALLAFGPNAPLTSGPSLNLSPSGDLTEAATRLFSALRELDSSGVAAIAVMPIPESGLGEAINDRLRRAAAGR